MCECVTTSVAIEWRMEACVDHGGSTTPHTPATTTNLNVDGRSLVVLRHVGSQDAHVDNIAQVKDVCQARPRRRHAQLHVAPVHGCGAAQVNGITQTAVLFCGWWSVCLLVTACCGRLVCWVERGASRALGRMLPVKRA